MSNAVVRAAQSLTLAEKRLLSSAIAELNSMQGPWTPGQLRVRLTAVEYAETFGLDPRTGYDELKASADSIMKKHIRWTEQHGRHERVNKMQWVGRATYAAGEGFVEVVFYHELAPHLLHLQKEFTSYRLKQASALRSLYAWRLLELLEMFRDTGVLKMTIEEFHHAMDTPDSYRKNFKGLRVRVIEPSVAELRDKDGWLIQWETEKRGRRVVGLVFLFRPDPQGRLPLDAPQQPPALPPLDPPKEKPKRRRRLTRKEIEAAARPGESWEEAADRLRGNG